MDVDVECIVVGAGVIGLACARALSNAGRDVLVVDGANTVGTGTSSRNSEVIHAGIYYAPGSLKARLCVEGRKKLYAYCDARGISYRRLGKLIVATRKEQLAALHNIAANAKINGVVLQYLTAHMAQEKEPALACHGALLSPETGIIDSHALMLALQADAERAGAQFVFHTPCTGGQIRGQAGFELTFGADSSTKLRCSLLVNAAGLDATNLARNIRGLPATAIAPTFFCKGSYFTLNGRSPFSHLIYPLPNTAGLGIHLTLDLGGQARFGPDVEWVTQADYTVHVGKRDAFSNAVREYWPGLPDEALAPGYAGIRPKIAGPGHTFSDFVISGPQDHGIAGLVNLFGIESPGLTASLAIADVVAELLK